MKGARAGAISDDDLPPHRPNGRYGLGMADEDGALARIVGIAVQTMGAGAGALFGANVDPSTAAVAAMAGTGIAAVGADIARRVLSPRQELRVGEVFLQAGAAIKAKEVLGEHIREDGFFDEGHRSAGHEFAEGVILAAMDSFEEKKIPYLANLMANVAVTPTVDAHTANFALRVADKLSWLQLCLLGIIDRPEDYPMPEEPFEEAKQWDRHTVRTTLQLMADVSASEKFLFFGTVMSEGGLGLQLYDLNLSGIKRGNNGLLITGLMELGTIPRADLDPIYEALLKDDPGDAVVVSSV